MATKKDKKVFDVAKPGESKPDIGSKPMIVGHKSMANDPMVTATKESGSTDQEKDTSNKEKAKEQKVGTTLKKKIEPLTSAEKKTASTDSTQSETATSSGSNTMDETDRKSAESTSTNKNKAPQVDTQDAKGQEDVDTDPSAVENNGEDTTKKEKKLDPVALAMEREENLKKIIESKKYFLNINEKKSGSPTTFVVAFLGTMILGLAVLYALIDAEVLDVDYELPLRIIGN